MICSKSRLSDFLDAVQMYFLFAIGPYKCLVANIFNIFQVDFFNIPPTRKTFVSDDFYLRGKVNFICVRHSLDSQQCASSFRYFLKHDRFTTFFIE